MVDLGTQTKNHRVQDKECFTLILCLGSLLERGVKCYQKEVILFWEIITITNVYLALTMCWALCYGLHVKIKWNNAIL